MVDWQKIQVIVPIYHPDNKFIELLKMLKRQSIERVTVLIIDSGSHKDWLNYTEGLDLQVEDIDSSDFNHGGTRQMGINMCIDKEIFIFLTQDAILADEYSLENLVNAFENPSVGCAYGRQIPHKSANRFAAFARLYNYPAESWVRSFEDRHKYGLKTAFMSDSFAAYRKSAMEQVGGFPLNVVVSEDMYVAAKMLMHGWKVAYVAEARVYHSHNFTAWQEFKRYRDIGRFHAKEKWIREIFGKAEENGKEFVLAQVKFLKNNPLLLGKMIFSNGVKFLGYRIGLFHKCRGCNESNIHIVKILRKR